MIIETLKDEKLIDKTAMELASANGNLKFLRSVLEEMKATEHSKKTLDTTIEKVNKVIGYILDNRELDFVPSDK
tara:strand:+ start:1540 stop:1761 length:222 start_codon:yes stop_codon:yes gene_type:complete